MEARRPNLPSRKGLCHTQVDRLGPSCPWSDLCHLDFGSGARLSADSKVRNTSTPSPSIRGRMLWLVNSDQSSLSSIFFLKGDKLEYKQKPVVRIG